MAPSIDMGVVADLFREAGIEFITNTMAIQSAWKDLAEKYCKEKGISPISHRVFLRRWKNQKFYSQKKVRMQELGVTHKEFVKISRERSKSQANFSSPKRCTSNILLETQTPVKEKVSQQPIRLEAMLASQQLKLKIEEIQQRLKFNEELFKLHKEKLQLDIEYAKLILKEPSLHRRYKTNNQLDFIIDQHPDI